MLRYTYKLKRYAKAIAKLRRIYQKVYNLQNRWVGFTQICRQIMQALSDGRNITRVGQCGKVFFTKLES